MESGAVAFRWQFFIRNVHRHTIPDSAALHPGYDLVQARENKNAVIPAGIAGIQLPGKAIPPKHPASWIPAIPAGMTN